ncbi:hypothetical protein JB92DRAFT_3068975, partial [Gautieria morchelliformis]
QPNLIRVPFYHVFKTSPPLNPRAFYFYSVHLHPLMAKDEVEIDAALERIRQIWKSLEHVASGQGPREAMAGGAGVRYQPPAPEPAGPTQLAYTLWQTYGPDLTALSMPRLNLTTSSPFPSTSAPASHPYAQPPSQPQPHDSRARGTTPAIDMHPDAMLLAQRRALRQSSLRSRPRIHMAKRLYSRSAARYFLVPHDTVRQVTAASSTYLLAPEIGSVDEGEGAGDDRGGARASSGSW